MSAHEFVMFVMMVFVFGGGFWVLRPVVGALAKRIAREGTPPVASGDRE